YAMANALLVILSFAFIVTNTSLGTFKTFLLIYLSFGILLALIGLGRSGSNFNYFIPVAVPLAMMSLLTLKELLQQFRFCNVVIMCALFILFAQSYLEVNSTVAYSYRFLNHRIWPPTHSDAQASLHQTRVQLKALKTKSVFCDEPGTCTLLGFKPTYFYFEQNSQDVAKARLEDYDTYLLSDIPSRDLTWTKVKLPSSLVQILEEQYQLTALTPLGVVYTKKPAQ
ncbi:MAG: hypothetical protein J7501_18585, partial [Bdellovibrio sp.]|nr:hypothetical protein [Bdellovibrio sp.]